MSTTRIVKRNSVANIIPCPACLNSQFRFIFTKKGRDFWRCTCCNLEKQYPLPTLDEIRDYYDDSYADGLYKEFTDASTMKQLTAQQRFKEIYKYCGTGRWLDIGCADGRFVEHARRNGLNAEGIELSEVAVDQGKSRGLPIACSTIEDWDPSYRYDTITSFDVLEHVLDPVGYLQFAHQLLMPSGTLVLTVPNTGSLIRKIMGPRWFFYIPEEHLHYFDPSNIKLILEKTGFQVRKCSWTFKVLTYQYALTQFKEYNPLVYNLLNFISKVLPKKLLAMPIPLYIGEMKVVAIRN
jgi:2-polyprenyl-3-methyl-5-hydroxy-6-metoxy-1,4-benzoquinol methylase